MDLIAGIIRGEVDFARDFSNPLDRPWGVLYYNTDIPDSHDSNHACIVDGGTNLHGAVDEVIRFYRSRQLTPRVYHLATERGEALRSILAAKGFAFQDHKTTFLVHQQKASVRPRCQIIVQRVTRMTGPLCEMIERSDSVRHRKVLERRLSHWTYHLLVGFLRNQPISMAALQVVGEMTRVDDVLTDLPHRGHGYSRTVIDHLVRYHSQHLRNTLYLYTDNPTAERIYREAGFVDVGVPLHSWAAWLEDAQPGGSTTA